MSGKTLKIKGRVVHQAKYAGSVPLSVITKAVDQVTGSIAGHSLDTAKRRNRKQLHRGQKKKK